MRFDHSAEFSCTCCYIGCSLLPLNLLKNEIVRVRNTKYENFDVTGKRRLSDSQPQDKSVVCKECCRGWSRLADVDPCQ